MSPTHLTLLAALLVLSACDGGSEPPACARQCTAPTFTTLELVAGQPGGSGLVDGVGTAVHFSDPFALAGNATQLFVADGSAIRVVDTTSATVRTLAGSFAVTGGDDGVGAAAMFFELSGLVETGGVLYATDTENHTIRKIDVASAKVTTVGGMYGLNGTTDALGTAARFREPEGLALGKDVLYIADTDNNTIRAMDLVTGAVSTLAGMPGAMGNVDAVGKAARFSKPKAMILDHAGHLLYVVDSDNMSLRKLVLADAAVSTVATFSSAPTGMAWDGAKLLLSLDQRVVRLDLDTGAISTVAGATNQMGFVDAVGTDARFSQHPVGLLNDGQGGVYVADEGNYALRHIDLASGAVTTFAGARSSGNADGRRAHAHFWGPQGMAIDASGIAYVADTNNHTIRKVVVASGEVTTLAGMAGKSGNSDGAAARFNQPSGVALDEVAHVLYVADAGNAAIRKLDLASGLVTTLPRTAAHAGAHPYFSHPAGLTLDGQRLFITDSGSHTVLSFDLETKTVNVLAGTTMLPGSVDGTGSTARFYAPTGIVSDGHGNLFIADLMNDAIRKLVVATGEVTTIAGTLDVQGSDDGVGQKARFAYPSALALHASGQLFVADSNNNTVREIDVASGKVTTVIGAPTLAGVQPGPLPAQLTAPSALALTADGQLAVFSENALLLAH